MRGGDYYEGEEIFKSSQICDGARVGPHNKIIRIYFELSLGQDSVTIFHFSPC